MFCTLFVLLICLCRRHLEVYRRSRLLQLPPLADTHMCRWTFQQLTITPFFYGNRTLRIFIKTLNEIGSELFNRAWEGDVTQRPTGVSHHIVFPRQQRPHERIPVTTEELSVLFFPHIFSRLFSATAGRTLLQCWSLCRN